MLCAPCHPETPARKHVSNVTALNRGSNSDRTAYVFLFWHPTMKVHRINSCTGVDVTLQERSQGTTWLPYWLMVAILSLLILYDPPESACQSYTALSGRHKGHQRHPSLAQLLLEGLFIFFSWLLGHKEESQAKQPSLCWAHCISIPLQSTGSESSCAQAAPATVSVSGQRQLWSTGSSHFYLQNTGAPGQNYYIYKHLLQRIMATDVQNPKLQNNREDQKGPYWASC